MPPDAKFLIVAAVVVIVLLLVLGGVPGRKTVADKQDRVCRACRLAHPYFAQFCRNCGSKL